MVNTNMFEFKHPKYYKELRKRNKDQLSSTLFEFSELVESDQAISRGDSTEAGRRASGPGLKHQASSSKPQATSSQAASDKLQAPSYKHQASSRKRQAP